MLLFFLLLFFFLGGGGGIFVGEFGWSKNKSVSGQSSQKELVCLI